MKDTALLLQALEHLKPAALSYNEWTQVGMALKSEGLPVSVWEEWSQADARYHPGECAAKWASFQSDGVSGGTVVKMAYDRGMPKPQKESRTLGWDDIIGGSVKDTPVPTEAPSERNPKQELITYLETLFEPNEIIGYCTEVWQSEDRLVPGKGAYTRTAGNLIRALKEAPDVESVIGTVNPAAGAWIRFNPLDGKGVKNENVTAFRYALVECDNLPIEEQVRLIRKLRLPVATLVHSGKKSIHAIVKVGAKDYAEYRERVKRIYAECAKAGLTVDEQNKNPSRLSRMPGVERNGKPQYLMATEIGLSDYDTWLNYAENEADTLPDFIDVADVYGKPVKLSDELVCGLLRRGHKGIIIGPSKAGKSFLLIQLACAIAAGSRWLETFPCYPGKVLYCNFEIDPNSFLNRVTNVVSHMSCFSRESLHNLHVWNLRGHALLMDSFAPALIRRIKDEKYAAVIIDPIYKLNAGDENAAGDMAKFLGLMDTICASTGASVVYAHHHAKGDMSQRSVIDRGSGSGVLARDPDAIMDLSELDISEEAAEQHRVELINRHIRNWCRANLGSDFDSECEWSADNESNLRFALSMAAEANLDADDLKQAFVTLQNQEIKGFRMDFVLREFASPKPLNIWFDYPLHYADTNSLLGKADFAGSARAKAHETKRKQTAEAEEDMQTRLTEALEATDRRLDSVAAFLGISGRTLRRYLGRFGYKIEKGIIRDYQPEHEPAPHDGTNEGA